MKDSHLQVPLLAVAGLLAAFTIKHFVADFLLQTAWIARGKEARSGWLGPLAVHAAGHGALTLLIALAVQPRLWWLAVVDLVTHFSLDRCKALVGQRLGSTPQEAGFWWLLGLDQMLHGLTNIGLTGALLAV